MATPKPCRTRPAMSASDGASWAISGFAPALAKRWSVNSRWRLPSGKQI